MSTLIPSAPHGWQVSGQLYDAEHPELLNQDMAELDSPTGDILITAGWDPEEDPNGRYFICVFRSAELIEGPIYISGMQATASKLRDLAYQHSGSVFNASDDQPPFTGLDGSI